MLNLLENPRGAVSAWIHLFSATKREVATIESVEGHVADPLLVLGSSLCPLDDLDVLLRWSKSSDGCLRSDPKS